MIAYSAAQLNCATFRETAESKILTASGGRTRHQTSARRGVWQFRAEPSNERVALEGWLDSLSITRRSEEAEISPDTDGLLGGRYRGTLNRAGNYTAELHPFVPDEVAEVAGMQDALSDFFPSLPRRAVAVGALWTDSLGLTIRRLPDSASAGVALRRFELQKQEEARATRAPGDSVTLELRQQSEERGQFVWHPLYGLVRWDRTIVVETSVPPGQSVRQAVRSEVEQRVTLVRVAGQQRCPAAGVR